jgi:hypothetical protein
MGGGGMGGGDILLNRYDDEAKLIELIFLYYIQNRKYKD